MVSRLDHSRPDYDIVISGGGCAGLSLAWHLYRHGPADKRILLIDPETRDRNPRTWCYWNPDAVPFHHLRRHSWKRFTIHTSQKELTCRAGSFPGYHAIDSGTYRNWIYGDIAGHPRLEIRHTHTDSWNETNKQVTVQTGEGDVTAGILFQNHHRESDPYRSSRLGIRQHFIGREIETDRELFNPASATFMDFRVDQTRGLAFMYVLPWSERSALFEFTFFTPEICEDHVYENGIRTYLDTHYGLKEPHYSTIRTERGVIPMTENLYLRGTRRVRPIGVISGAVKPSSGYAFTRIQKQCRYYADQLKYHEIPSYYPPSPPRFRLYDRIMLRIIKDQPATAVQAFARLFSSVPTSRMLRFLDEETKPKEEVSILNSVPRLKFLNAAGKELMG